MNRRKLHISPALQLGIAVLLLLCCMTVAVGVTFARYHKGEKGSLIFEPEQNLQVCLGYIENDSFVCSQNEWMRFEEQLQLAFAISNGSSNHEFAPADQMVCLRVVASLGVFNEEMAIPLSLTVGGNTYTATVQPIVKDSVLYTQFGDGWVFRFCDAEGNELQWELAGGQFSYIQALLCVDATVGDTSLLRLQAVAEVKES